jgi:hypothetical protein
MPEQEHKSGEPAIWIGLSAIYEKVEAIDDCIQEIKATMAAQGHEERLKTVEKRVYQMPTFSVVISLAAVIVAIVSVVKGLP